MIAVGNLARKTELDAKVEVFYTRFCLVGNDYGRRDEEGAAREFITSLWFTAFGALGEAIAKNALKGDQLIVEARVRSNNWPTSREKSSTTTHSFSKPSVSGPRGLPSGRSLMPSVVAACGNCRR